MKLEIVPLEEKFYDFVLNLRNNPEVKIGFVEQNYIERDDHLNYMETHAKSYFVCLVDEDPAGYIGVINDDIRVATSPKYQNKGVASFMIKFISEKFPAAVAKVKIGNIQSLKVFEKNGYKPIYIILSKLS